MLRNIQHPSLDNNIEAVLQGEQLVTEFWISEEDKLKYAQELIKDNSDYCLGVLGKRAFFSHKKNIKEAKLLSIAMKYRIHTPYLLGRLFGYQELAIKEFYLTDDRYDKGDLLYRFLEDRKDFPNMVSNILSNKAYRLLDW